MNIMAMTAAAANVPLAERVAGYDWDAIGAELNAYGCAVLPNLLTTIERRGIAALYPNERHFRSHIHMARHGFGKGEYRYFNYPLPTLLAELRTALYPRLAQVANPWNERMGVAERFPRSSRRFPQSVPCRRPDPADAAAAAIWPGRLQLLASGSVWRARFPAAGRDPAVAARPRFHRRRVRPDRAAPTHAEPRRSGAAWPGRCASCSPSTTGRCRAPRRLPRQSAARRQPRALRPASHARHHLPRCEIAFARAGIVAAVFAGRCSVSGER